MKRFNKMLGNAILFVFVFIGYIKFIWPIIDKSLDWIAYRIVDLREIIEDMIEELLKKRRAR